MDVDSQATICKTGSNEVDGEKNYERIPCKQQLIELASARSLELTRLNSARGLTLYYCIHSTSMRFPSGQESQKSSHVPLTRMAFRHSSTVTSGIVPSRTHRYHLLSFHRSTLRSASTVIHFYIIQLYFNHHPSDISSISLVLGPTWGSHPSP